MLTRLGIAHHRLVVTGHDLALGDLVRVAPVRHLHLDDVAGMQVAPAHREPVVVADQHHAALTGIPGVVLVPRPGAQHPAVRPLGDDGLEGDAGDGQPGERLAVSEMRLLHREDADPVAARHQRVGGGDVVDRRLGVGPGPVGFEAVLLEVLVADQDADVADEQDTDAHQRPARPAQPTMFPGAHRSGSTCGSGREMGNPARAESPPGPGSTALGVIARGGGEAAARGPVEARLRQR